MIQAKLKSCDGCSELKVIWKNYLGKRYCKQCWSCHEGNVKQKPTVKRSPIPQRSEKRIKEERLYSAQRIIYLGEHPLCEFHIAGICTHVATEVHHKEGRTGKRSPIPQRSEKRIKKERLYSAQRIIYLGEHPLS